MMKSSTRLDSISFQLTPTRTRCDLVISANGKTEKIASGFLEPFLSHLKAAQEQNGKGGYSIVLEPIRGSDTTWFTKGTVERFVRFVSTPEILERVYTIESEILQIEKAIALQSSNVIDFHNAVDLPVKSEESLEGSKPALTGNYEKAIVLYQPANHQAKEDGSTIQEKNSKVQLVQVLETRKTVLQKEQGMAFARAVAASFDIDNIATLLPFAECFGASRMMDACKKFMHLWKAKHESGQWVDVEATEAMSCTANVPSTNATGIVFHSPNDSSQGETASERNGRSDQHHQSQSYPMFAPWQMNPQGNGMPPFQPYSMQNMPYYQNYPGNMFFQPPYPPAEDFRLHPGQRTRRRRHSMDNGDMSTESETQETMQDDVDSDEEDSVNRRQRNRGGKSSRKKSGTVVIRNINYIASAKQGSGDSNSESCSDSDSDDDGGHNKGDETRKSRKKGVSQTSDNQLRSSARDDGHWQAFQNFLLTDADESSNSAKNMFAMEGKVQGRKRQTDIGDASSTLGRHSIGGSEDVGFSDRFDISGDTTCMRKRVDDPLSSRGQEANLRLGSVDSQMDLQFGEGGSQRRAYRRSADTDMDYMFSRQDKLTNLADSSLDPVINELQGSVNENDRGSSHAMVDESFVVLHRTGLDQAADYGRAAMDMEYQPPSVPQKTDNHTVGTSQGNYEPNDLNLMPNRGMEYGQSGYDPAIDYEMEAQLQETTQQSGKIRNVTSGTKQEPKRPVKDQKLKTERTPGSNRRDKPSKLSPSEDARARAEKLRAFKADLQKQKKEQEQEQLKRLEALKIERQKRIAARSGATVPQSPTPSHQSRKQLPKLSPISQKGSKFSDTEPGSSSPLQRSTLKLIPKRLSDSSKISKAGRSNSGNQSNENRLTRSASSLSMRKEENNGPTPESKATIARIRRLSEPKSSTSHVSSGKTRSAEALSRHRVAEKAGMKKMPATVDPDNAKSVSLSEQKLRASKGSSGSIQKKPIKKEKSQKPSEKMLSAASVSSSLSKGNSPPARDGDDNTIVEKTVVMLECEKPAAPVFCQPEDETSGHIMQLDSYKDPCGKSDEDASIPPPASPIIVKEVGSQPPSREVKGHSYTCVNEPEEVSPNFNVGATEKPYQAPYARVSSVEDPCMAESDYGKAPPTSFSTEVAGVQATTALVSDGQKQDLVKKTQAASGKQQGKDSPKGFKRLLMFGKRSSAASESNIELDKASLDDSMAGDNALHASSSEAFTLKNLLIQEESSSAGTTPKKSSRSFSLLSPFKSKNTEKKSAT